MQFVANQIISFCISGAFGLVWIAFLIFPSLNGLLERVKSICDDYDKFLILFCTFILAYPLGIALNSLANTFFKDEDKEIRKKLFDKYGFKEGIDEISELYHIFRYRLYLKSPSAYEYLSFHRESIRILRATALNMLLISLSLLTMTSYKPIILYLMIALIFLFILFQQFINNTEDSSHDKQQQDKTNKDKEKEASLMKRLLATASVLIIFYNILENSGLSLVCILSLIALFFSLLAYLGWKKQQKNFYKTIILFYEANLRVQSKS
jgi:hypothetical protein